MSGGSVRDRIKAAEALQGGPSGENSSNSRRRGHRLSLKTDEHIKEEFLRRGDGGWHKKVDIGQQEKFLPRPDLPPIIKLTADTPVVPEPRQRLPGKLPRRGSERSEDMSILVDGQPPVPIGQDHKQMQPTVVELPPVIVSEPVADSHSADESSEKKEEDWDRVARLEAEQQAAMDAEANAERVARMEAEQQAAMDAEAANKKAATKKASTKKAAAKKAEDEAPKIIPGSFDAVPEPPADDSSKHKEDDWDRVRRLEAEQQAHMDAEAALSEAAIKEAAEEEHADWDRVRRMEAAQQARMDAEAALEEDLATEAAEHERDRRHAEMAHSHDEEVPIGRFADLLVDPPSRKQSSAKPKERERIRIQSQTTQAHSPVKHKTVREVPTKPPTHTKSVKEDLSHCERILFDPLEWERKQRAKEERHAARKHSNAERLSVDTGHKEKSRARSPSIRLLRVDHSDDDEPVHRERRESRDHRRRSHSRSDHKHESDVSTPPDSARRSSSSLWPSFSNSERRSMGNILEAPSRSHSRHRRSTSDAHSTITTKTDVSSKNLEFVEYIAGKKIDHMPHSPPKSPPRPMGFVRSHSHTGEYSEGYTRDKKLLKKPTEHEVLDHLDHDWDRKAHHEGRHRSHSHKKDDPWQLKLLNQLAGG